MKPLPSIAVEDLLKIFHRRYATIIATNRYLEDRGKILGDYVATSAIPDRLLESRQIIKITSLCYRLKGDTKTSDRKRKIDNEQ